VAQVEVAPPCNVFYGLSDDTSLVTVTVVNERGIVASWAMTDAQCQMHIDQVTKYRRLLRRDAMQGNLQ
jgi:hypothetical protein